MFNSLKNKSFIFSLTNNQKFIEKSSSNSSITSKPFSGPIFGSLPGDIFIHDKANIAGVECSIGNSFSFDGDEKSLFNFGGAISNEKFKAK